jgi:hypothetical protein
LPRRARAVPKTVYQLKVTLKHVRPPVWRRLLVPSDIRLDKLHLVLQRAMGWHNSHLHEFSLGDRRIGGRSPIDHREDADLEDEREVRLNELVGPGQALHYEYDFGDGWRHKVSVEKVLEPSPSHASPQCVGGARACPPEDCGGPAGYEHLLMVLKDPTHQEHAGLHSWIGGTFDPEAFDPTRVNAALRLLG